MRRTLVCLLCLALSTVSVAKDKDDIEKTPADSKEITALVKQLNHKQFAKREAAGKALKEMGEKIHPILEKTLKRKDLPIEAALRIRAILKAAAAAKASKNARTVTDPATGMTFTLSDDGQTVSARNQGGQVMWRMTTGQRQGAALTIEGRLLVIQPIEMRVDLATGKTISIGRPRGR